MPKAKETTSAEIARLEAEVERLRAAHEATPTRCPITGLGFFMTIRHPELGWVHTYGGPYHSYTIPRWEDSDPETPIDETGLIRERYNHDADAWEDGGEVVPYRIIDEERLDHLREEAEKVREIGRAIEAIARRRG